MKNHGGAVQDNVETTDLYTQIGNGTRLGERRADRFSYANEPISVHCPSFGSLPMCPDRLRLPSWLTIPAETGLGQLSQGSRYGSHHAPFPGSISRISGDIVANRQWNTVNFIIARVYMNISDNNWPNNVEFRGNFHRYAPSTAGSQEIILTVELSNPKSTRATDWQIYATCITCVCSQNCGLLSTHNLLIIHMNECTCTEFLWHFFQASNLMPKLWGQNHARISPMLATARFQSGFGTLWHVITY